MDKINQPVSGQDIPLGEQETIAQKIDLPIEEIETNDNVTGDASLSAEVLQSEVGGNRALIFGGIGCVLLLCVGLLGTAGLLTAGSFLFNSSVDKVVVEVTTEPIAPVTVETTNDTKLPTPEDLEDTAEPTSQPDEFAITDPPSLSKITFAATAAPDKTQDTFKTGVEKILATFEYDNLTSEALWTQVWYHNDQEVLRSSQPWLEDENGVYEYTIEAGSGPLSEGRWALEFYINEELVTSGSFEISDDAENSQNLDEAEPEEIAKIFKLVYTKWDGEKHNLYVGDTEGSSERFVLRGGAGPSWSPDGRYIFFYGEEGVDHQFINGQRHSLTGVTNGIARLNASPLPGNVTQLQLFQGHGWNDGTARWANVSPDGSMIAYDGDRGGGRRVYFLGTNANQQFRFEIIGEQADWSPDSQKIVYRSGRNNQTGIWISNRTDSGHTRITAGGTDSFPTWSPDGETIAFSRDVGGNVDIYTVKPDGNDLARLTDVPGQDTLPVFLPTGELVFRSARGGQWNIWKMDGDGSNQTQIIANAGVGPEWSFSKMGVLR